MRGSTIHTLRLSSYLRGIGNAGPSNGSPSYQHTTLSRFIHGSPLGICVQMLRTVFCNGCGKLATGIAASIFSFSFYTQSQLTRNRKENPSWCRRLTSIHTVNHRKVNRSKTMSDQQFLKRRYLARIKPAVGPIVHARFQQFAKEALQKRASSSDFAKPIKMYMQMVPEWDDKIYSTEKKMLFSLKTAKGVRFQLREYINNIVQAEMNILSRSSAPLRNDLKRTIDLTQWVRELYAYCASEFGRHPTWLYSKKLQVATGSNKQNGLQVCFDAIEHACDAIVPVDDLVDDSVSSSGDDDELYSDMSSSGEESGLASYDEDEIEDPIDAASKGHRKKVVVKKTPDRSFARIRRSDDYSDDYEDEDDDDVDW